MSELKDGADECLSCKNCSEVCPTDVTKEANILPSSARMRLPDFKQIDEELGNIISVRGKCWMEFAFKVLLHVEEYTIPQYGDKGQDQITDWSAEDCLIAVKKRIARYGRNSREGQQELDFMKMAHEIQIAAEKYDESVVGNMEPKLTNEELEADGIFDGR